MTKTYMQKPAEVERQWHLVDAKGQVLGRLATQIAQKLVGKHKPTYTPHVDGGDFVVVINAQEVELTRNKANKKVYKSHSQYPGNLKEVPYTKMMDKHPEKVIQKAVYNMVPKNKLRRPRMARLKVFVGTEHPYQNQLTFSEKQAKE